MLSARCKTTKTESKDLKWPKFCAFDIFAVCVFFECWTGVLQSQPHAKTVEIFGMLCYLLFFPQYVFGLPGMTFEQKFFILFSWCAFDTKTQGLSDF